MLTRRCSIVPLRSTGQLLSRAFVVLLRKSIPQKHNLKAAAELNVTCVRSLLFRVLKVFVLRLMLFFARFEYRKRKFLVKFEVIFVCAFSSIVRFG